MADPADDDELIVIDAGGDVVISVSTDSSAGLERCSFRVDTASLRAASAYFRLLFDPNGYQEGAAVAAKRTAILQQYPSFSETPAEALPRVEIEDIGQTSLLKQPKFLMRDLLLIIHNTPGELTPRKMPLINLCNLAIVADRFDAIDAVRQKWVSKKGLPTTAPAKLASEYEETLRQRILVGVLFEHDAWLYPCSSRLIITGSELWRRGVLAREDADGTDTSLLASWWYLPRGVEEELLFRRNAILTAIASLQSQLLGQYTSREQQCRLGYDTSPQCDSFQLGEFVTFLASRAGTLDLRCAFTPQDARTLGSETAARDINVATLLSTLRQAPTYQLNTHHSHCGPRKLLIAGLDQIAMLVARDIGFCVECHPFSSGGPSAGAGAGAATAAHKRDTSTSSSSAPNERTMNTPAQGTRAPQQGRTHAQRAGTGTKSPGHMQDQAHVQDQEHFWSRSKPMLQFTQRAHGQLGARPDCRNPALARFHSLARDFFTAAERDWEALPPVRASGTRASAIGTAASAGAAGADLLVETPRRLSKLRVSTG